MSLSPIGPVARITPILPTQATGAAGAVGATSGASFANALSNGLTQLQQVQTKADNLAVQASTGTLADPAQLMIASTQASLATELSVAVRNKAVDAFNEIMRMQA